jgi:hypothetical protein
LYKMRRSRKVFSISLKANKAAHIVFLRMLQPNGKRQGMRIRGSDRGGWWGWKWGGGEEG